MTDDPPRCWRQFTGTDDYQHYCDLAKHTDGYCFCVLHGGVRSKTPIRVSIDPTTKEMTVLEEARGAAI